MGLDTARSDHARLGLRLGGESNSTTRVADPPLVGSGSPWDGDSWPV